MAGNCKQNTDPLKLVREGTNQDQRLPEALRPAYAPVDEHGPAHGMVFARAYSALLRYYGSTNTPVNDWQNFFSSDVSVLLAVAAIQDIATYKSKVKAYFDYLNNRDNETDEEGLKTQLGHLFSTAASLAWQLDTLKENLPQEIALRGALQNLIQSQLAEAYHRLLTYYEADQDIVPATDRLIADAQDESMVLFGQPMLPFTQVHSAGLSADWITNTAANWADYRDNIVPEPSVFGSGTSVFDRTNHIATHNLFTSIFDQFLKVYARVVSDAEQALKETLTNWDQHQPHYALFLAFLRLYEYVRTEANTLTGRHLDFYYREILQLKEKPAQPGHAHLLIELAKHALPYEILADTLFKAGKDDLGREAFFAADRDVVINQAKVADLKTVYRHIDTDDEDIDQDGRLFASPVANSDDGLGADLTSVDQSWHPFFNKIYENGKLTEIKMPPAEIGFALASHYLFLAEGERTITLDISYSGSFSELDDNQKDDILCLLTTEDGWLEKTPTTFKRESGIIKLEVGLSGGDPPITGYIPKTHGYSFDTVLPVMLCKLVHDDDFLYNTLEELVITNIELTVDVTGLRSLAVSNDFGPVDTSKPFQPYGASPVKDNALIVGSKEVFQKDLSNLVIEATWLQSPDPYETTPQVSVDYLSGGTWKSSGNSKVGVSSTTYSLTANLGVPAIDAPDLSEDEFYGTASRHGFARLKLDTGFGQGDYQSDLLSFLRKDSGATDPGTPPVGPVMNSLSLNYTAEQSIPLNSSDENQYTSRHARFFHIAPFGHAEQHPYLRSDHKVYLLPQFDFIQKGIKEESEAEFYIGISGLNPPQNLALLFEVVDGTADPLSIKPDPHLHWSYLSGNEWYAFEENEVEDLTTGLLESGIVTLSVPRRASDQNTLLPAGQHWIRIAVKTESDAVSRLQLVAAQALRTTFADRGNDPAFPARVLPAGTISKLNQPVAAVKKVVQPFESFGGKGAEAPAAFYTRVSERLRHKDRAITLWDYERLVLEAFPQIYKVRCLNHTQYEPSSSGEGIYRELAPGHVTIVTVPDQSYQNLRNPLRPYTSLGVLTQIEAFLRKRTSCFARLHVRNPRFEEVRVSFHLRLYEGFDETFYKLRLQEAITRFLSPWAFSNAQSPTFGGKIYRSVLINFVEEQPYVDYVTDFQMFHDIDGVQSNQSREEIEGATAVSILVSVPAEKHTITIIKPSQESVSSEKCDCET